MNFSFFQIAVRERNFLSRPHTTVNPLLALENTRTVSKARATRSIGADRFKALEHDNFRNEHFIDRSQNDVFFLRGHTGDQEPGHAPIEELHHGPRRRSPSRSESDNPPHRSDPLESCPEAHRNPLRQGR